MAFIDRLNDLEQRSLSELIKAHDYFVDTRQAWNFVLLAARQGKGFSVRNMTTNTTTTPDQLVEKARNYSTHLIAEATFCQFIEIFEGFFFDLLRIWLMNDPRSLGPHQVTLKEVLDAENIDDVVLHVVNKTLNELSYKRPRDWFDFLKVRTGIDGIDPREIEEIAEAKATRDILVHNRKIVNDIYVSKAGQSARFASGETIDVPDQYHSKRWNLLRDSVKRLVSKGIEIAQEMQ